MKVLTFGCSGTNEIENDERYTKRAQWHREHEKAYYECRRSTAWRQRPFSPTVESQGSGDYERNKRNARHEGVVYWTVRAFLRAGGRR
jgi:hypothetical protein